MHFTRRLEHFISEIKGGAVWGILTTLFLAASAFAMSFFVGMPDLQQEFNSTDIRNAAVVSDYDLLIEVSGKYLASSQLFLSAIETYNRRNTLFVAGDSVLYREGYVAASEQCREALQQVSLSLASLEGTHVQEERFRSYVDELERLLSTQRAILRVLVRWYDIVILGSRSERLQYRDTLQMYSDSMMFTATEGMRANDSWQRIYSTVTAENGAWLTHEMAKARLYRYKGYLFLLSLVYCVAFAAILVYKWTNQARNRGKNGGAQFP
jgi:hypothetical protein